jgi:hypothetical protein
MFDVHFHLPVEPEKQDYTGTWAFRGKLEIEPDSFAPGLGEFRRFGALGSKTPENGGL